jgi:hypothetical protein
MKTILLILFSILPASVSAQELKARATEPVRVTVAAPVDEANIETAEAVRGELRNLRDVVITDSRADFVVRICAVHILSDACGGYSVAVTVEDRSSRLTGLDCYTGPTAREVAAFIVGAIDRERFAPRRRALPSKKEK